MKTTSTTCQTQLTDLLQMTTIEWYMKCQWNVAMSMLDRLHGASMKEKET